MNTITTESIDSILGAGIAVILTFICIKLFFRILKQSSIIHDNLSWKKMNREAWNYECERVAKLNHWLDTHDSHEALMWARVALKLDYHLGKMSYHFRNL